MNASIPLATQSGRMSKWMSLTTAIFAPRLRTAARTSATSGYTGRASGSHSTLERLREFQVEARVLEQPHRRRAMLDRQVDAALGLDELGMLQRRTNPG